MTASEQCAEQCATASGLDRKAVPIAVWILALQVAAQCIALIWPDSELAVRSLRERRYPRDRAIVRLRRRLKRRLRRMGVPEEYWPTIFGTVYDYSATHATSGLLTAIWHDEMGNVPNPAV